LVRLAHVETVAPLLSKVANKQREEESRKRREMQFPQSAAEFNFIQDKELQQRIARFLTSGANVQDKMLNEYGWGWRQVERLKEEYMKDVSPIRSNFVALIKGCVVVNFQGRHTEKGSCCQRPTKKAYPHMILPPYVHVLWHRGAGCMRLYWTTESIVNDFIEPYV
jgi:hypothetical protein